jgi:hypothetical protein
MFHISVILNQNTLNRYTNYVIIESEIIRELPSVFNVAKSHLFYTGGFYLLEIYLLVFTLINKDRKKYIQMRCKK